MQRPRYEPNQHLLAVVLVSLLWSVRQHPILPLFLTYTQGENRIPSTVTGVLEYINHQLAEDILEALTDEPATEIVAPGTSCRMQLADYEQQHGKPPHPIEKVAAALN